MKNEKQTDAKRKNERRRRRSFKTIVSSFEYKNDMEA